MRAAILRKNGPTDSVEVGQMAAPAQRRDEVLVRVHAAAVNPADLKVCSGTDGGAFIHSKKFPMAIGYDFSGVVEKVGVAVVGRRVGDPVFGHLPYAMSTRQGSFADYVAVKPDEIGVKPEALSDLDAAASATAGCTALQALRDKGRLESGQRVLVNGASGGVGSFAVQIARLLGAEVWATASAKKAEFVRSLGATEVIDYRSTPMASIGQTFDLVLDAASMSSYAEVEPLLARGGGYLTLLPSGSLVAGMARSLVARKRCTFVAVKSRAADLDQLGSWLAAGQLSASVHATFDLAAITDALAKLASGSVQGKVAVRVAP